ncbi:MAG: LacI family DNA-binding transcriptional regulator [Brevefilum sp.]|nr:LacI family DNA-binding transcriptional regulator [Brevefilum sp.]
MKKNPTIRDVAKIAGVSNATVSRILNHKPDVSENTRRKVLQTIEEIGYAKSAQWQQITSGKSRVISLHYPRKNVVNNLISHDFIIGVSKACEENDYSLHLITKSLDEKTLLDLYRTNQSDGVILMEIRTQDWRMELLRENQLPFVMIGHCEENVGASFIDLDFKAAVIVAFDHLVALGHRNISYLPFPIDSGRERFGPTVRASAGLQYACQKHNVPQQTIEIGMQPTNIKDAILSLLNAFPQTTAIVSLLDVSLSEIYEALATKGLRIPADVSVVGLTNDQGAHLISPNPTQIQFPSLEMGYEAGKMLIEILESGTDNVIQNLIDPQLVVRASSGPVKVANYP